MMEDMIRYIIGICALTAGFLVLISVFGYILILGNEHQRTNHLPKIAFCIAILLMVILVIQTFLIGVSVGNGTSKSILSVYWLAVILNFIAIVLNFRSAFAYK